jgi:hypothetical protein
VPGRAERRAVVAGGRLHEHPVDRGQVGDRLVGLAVEERAAREAQPALPGALQPVLDEVDEHGGQALLQRGGEVGLVAVDVAVGHARGEGRLGEERAGVRVAALGLGEGARGPVDGHRAASGVDAGELLEHRAEAVGLAVGRESHDLVLVVVELEPEEAGGDRVEEAQRVADRRGRQALQRPVDGAEHRERLGLAHPVADHHQRAVEPAGHQRGLGVGDVVAHGAEAVGDARPAQRGEPVDHRRARVDLVERGSGDLEGTAVALVVEAVGDEVDVVGRESGLGEAPGDRLRGQAPGALLAGEALLGRRGHQAAVDDDRRGAVEALADALVERGEVRVGAEQVLLRVRQAGQAQDDHGAPQERFHDDVSTLHYRLFPITPCAGGHPHGHSDDPR